VLFNSYAFIFGFLPLVLALTYLAKPYKWPAKLVVTLLSLGFYAWWKPQNLIVLVGSILFNFFVGDRIQKAVASERQRAANAWLLLGIVGDLSLLGWFKYANFIADNLNAILGAGIHLQKIAFVLGLSFFTFQKLAYLIDSARGEARRMKLLDFSLFASFFPQLISGPIVHYSEIVPQLQRRIRASETGWNLMVGLVLFAIGLFKKTVIADTVVLYSDPLFDAAAKGAHFGLLSGWLAAVTFTLQVYFDFSGYSDMAIGLGRMLGIKLPLNFHSPLRAPSIIEYWRRWHMTLQRFILAYVFQPMSLPLNRFAANKGLAGWPAFTVAIAIPSFITFVLVGIWHGAGWTFVLYGVMHATYICINQYWRERRARRRRVLRKLKKPITEPGPREVLLYQAITLVAVLFSNVMFRAKSIPDAVSVWKGMIGLDSGAQAALAGLNLGYGLIATLILAVSIVYLAPNTQQIMRRFDPAYNWEDWKGVARAPLDWTWKPNTSGLVFAGLVLFFGIMFIQRGQAIFLYFNF
jgi:D-alanyl-lipoteichoic acid acyltransferase DltB (MBOAT superfamily)